jgi:hypothetical protein
MGLLKDLGISKYLKKVKDYTDTKFSELSGKIDNVSVKTTKSIQIKGGPLANDIEAKENWPDEWVDENNIRIIPADKTFEEVLESLFLTVEYGTVKFGSATWNPKMKSPDVRLSKSDTTQEVGSSIKITSVTKGGFDNDNKQSERKVSLAATKGYFLNDKYYSDITANFYSQDAEVDATDETLSCKWNNSVVDVNFNNISSDTKNNFIIEDKGNNYNQLVITQSGKKATVSPIETITVYASTNTQAKVPDSKAIFNDTLTLPEGKEKFEQNVSGSKTINIKGSYYYFIGTVSDFTDPQTFTREFIINNINTKRGFVSDINSSNVLMETVTIPSGGNTTYIIVPEEYTITNIINAVGGDGRSAWGQKEWDEKGSVPPIETIKFKLENGSEKTYNVFYIYNKSLDADVVFTKLKLGLK